MPIIERSMRRFPPYNFKVPTLEIIASDAIRLHLFEAALRRYLKRPISLKPRPYYDGWEYTQYRQWGLRAVNDFVAKNYQEYRLNIKKKLKTTGFTFRLTRLPKPSIEVVEAFTEESVREWKGTIYYAYRKLPEFKGPDFQPFTLKFLATEAVKKQWFIATYVYKLQLKKHKIFCLEHKIGQIERRLIHIEKQPHHQTWKYIAKWFN